VVSAKKKKKKRINPYYDFWSISADAEREPWKKT